jgi:hypothetical protein
VRALQTIFDLRLPLCRRRRLSVGLNLRQLRLFRGRRLSGGLQRLSPFGDEAIGLRAPLKLKAGACPLGLSQVRALQTIFDLRLPLCRRRRLSVGLNLRPLRLFRGLRAPLKLKAGACPLGLSQARALQTIFYLRLPLCRRRRLSVGLNLRQLSLFRGLRAPLKLKAGACPLGLSQARALRTIFDLRLPLRRRLLLRRRLSVGLNLRPLRLFRLWRSHVRRNLRRGWRQQRGR